MSAQLAKIEGQITCMELRLADMDQSLSTLETIEGGFLKTRQTFLDTIH